jgi:hypothetical protein
MQDIKIRFLLFPKGEEYISEFKTTDSILDVKNRIFAQWPTGT